MSKYQDRLRRYGFALVILALGPAVMAIPGVHDRSGTAILVYFFAVLLSAWYGGLGPGLLTTVAIVLMTSHTSFPFWRVVRLGLGIASGVSISVLAEVLHVARRRAEASKQWLTAVLTGIADAVIATDVQGRVGFLNPVAQTLTGWSPQDAVGRPLTEIFRIVSEETQLAVEHPVERVLRDGTMVGLANHTTLIDRDGNQRPIDHSGAPIREKGGAIAGAVLVFRDVSQRREADVVRARLAAIVDSSTDAIIGKNLDGVITSWNDGAHRIFGYRAEEIVGAPVPLLIPPDRHDEEIAILKRIERGERVEHYESVRITKDGRRIDVSLMVSPIRDATRRVIGASKIARDITEHKRAAEAQEQRARLLDQAFDPIFVWEFGGGILFWNEGARELYGFAAAEALGRVSHELLHTIFPGGFTAYEAALRELGRWEGELRHQTKNGCWVTVDSRQLLVHQTGRPVQVLEANRDITERKRAEEQLGDSERMLRRSQTMAHVGSWELDLRDPSDLGCNALRWSEECFRIFGFEPGEVAVTNELFLRAVHKDDRDAVAAAMAKSLRENRPYEIEHRILRPDGTECVVQEWGEIVADSGGRPIRMIGTCQDVTERKQAARALKQYAERLEALSRQLIRAQEDERRRIARELHDEVGQSLTAAKITLDRLARDHSGCDLGRQLADASAMSGQALDQVRDLSRLLRPSLLDDLGLAQALRALLERLTERTGLGAESEIDEIGPVDPDLETACYRIAQEALTNAVKHAEATRLRVTLHRTGDDLELVVEDDGTGFDVSAAMAKAVRGTSLGVLTLQERAMLAGGRTEILSGTGGGTRVRTLIPARGRRASLDSEEEER